MKLPLRLLIALFAFYSFFNASAQFNVEIVAGSATVNINGTSPFNPTADNAQLGVNEILAALAIGDAVINTNTGGLQAGNITLSTDLDFNGSGLGNLLTLNAEGDVALNGSIFDGTTGDFESISVNVNAAGSVNGGTANITTGGGSITIQALSASVNSLATNNDSGGDIFVNTTGGNITIDGSVSASGSGGTGGNIDLISAGDLGGAATLALSSSSEAAGNITINANGDISSDLNFDVTGTGGGSISVTTLGTATVNVTGLNTVGLTGSGNVTFNVGGDLTIQTGINISTSSGNGGVATLNAGFNLFVGGTINTSADNNGGNQTLSAGGTITTGDLTADGLSLGGTVDLLSNGSINVGVISSTSNGNGGVVEVWSDSEDVTVNEINTNSSFAAGGPVSLWGRVITSGPINSSGSTDGGSVIISAYNEIDFTGASGSVVSSGTAAITLGPAVPFVDIVLGGAADLGGGFLDLLATDLEAINQTTFSQLVIGSGIGSGSIILANNLAFSCDALIQSPDGGVFDADAINFYQLDGGGNSLTLNFGGDVFIAGLSNNGGDIAIIGNNISTYSGQIDMTASGGSPLDAGTLSVNANGTLSLNAISTANSTPAGISGNINLTAVGDITVNGNINTDNVSGAGNGGSVSLISSSGNVSSSFQISSSSSSDTGGSVTINAVAGNVTFGDIILSGSLGSGGIDITANDEIFVGSLDAGGSAITLNAPGTLSGITTGIINSTDVGAGNITINTGGTVNTSSLVAAGQAGAAISVTGTDISTAAIDISGGSSGVGSLSLDGNNITIGGTINADSDFSGGDITVNATGSFTTGGPNFNFSSQATVGGQGGNLIISADVIPDSLGINLNGVDAGGTATIDVLNGNLFFSSYTSTGTNSSLSATASGDIFVASTMDMQAPSFGAGGVVNMTSLNGSIQFLGASILASGADEGGKITLTADGLIDVGVITANYDNVSGLPGFVDLTSKTSSISFFYINTESLNETGGDVSLSAFGSVIGNGSFLASNGETTTISTIGSVGNGNVFIEHSAGMTPDFEIGQNVAPANGIFGDLAADPTVASDNFLNSTISGGIYTSGDSRIIIQITEPPIDVNDSLALVALYQSTNGSSWTNKTGWEFIDAVGSPLPVDQWYGVSVNGGRVTALNLGFLSEGNNLSGTIPAEIGNLTALDSLYLGNGQIEGTIPTEIGNLSNLEILYLAQNQLTGNIPTEIGNLTNLRELRIYDNLLTGTIPLEIGSIPNLRFISLRGNQLTGSIPTEFGNLSNLELLYLYNNQLSGSIPSELSNLSNLSVLSLYNNQFSGDVPGTFTSLSSLSFLELRDNNLSGLPDLSSLTGLSTFTISNNQFTFEDIEPNVSVITENTGQQPFGGVEIVSANIGDDVTLAPLLPSPATGNENYQWRFNGTDLIGEINTTLNLIGITPGDFGEYILYISSSAAVGDTIIINSIFLQEIGGSELLTNGDFETGTGDGWSGNAVNVIDDGGGNFVNFVDVTVAGNSFDVNLSQAVNITQDQAYTLSFDAFSNVNRSMDVGIGLNEAPFTATIETINLDTFNQSYSIPLLATGFGGPNSRVIFDMGAETGQITIDNVSLTQGFPAFDPVLVSDSLALVSLYNAAGGSGWFNNTNWLTTSVEAWHGVSVENGRIVEIELANNNLTGSLPDSLNLLSELRILGVARNNLTGPLPSDLSNLTNLQELKIGRNGLSGTLPEYISTFSQLNRFGMSNNEFTGSVPASYANLSNLGTWNISGNNLTGLPDLRNLNQLGNFNVSFNQIPEADIILNNSVITQNDGQVDVASNITTDTTWSGLVIMKGAIFVEPGVTLTIDPGTIVKATEFPDITYLAVARDATINAVGTSTDPIIFTTTADDIKPGRKTGDNLNEFDRGFWGGVLLLGNAQIGAQNGLGADTVALPIEGISDPLGTYGGLDDADNSGIMQYVSIRHGGLEIGAGNQINGLTLAAVGSGTTVDNIEVFACFDDGIEFFGGAVSASNIVVNHTTDDALDTDQDYLGTVSNFAIVSPDGSGLELDGPENVSGISRGGNHLFTDGSISAGNSIFSIVDWDNGTNAAVQNLYITGLASGYATINGNTVIQSFDGVGGGSSNWEISTVDGLTAEDVLGIEANAITTEVAQGANTVGVNASGFDWTYSGLKGYLRDFGLNPPAVPESDSTALVALYNATDGPNWSNNTNWLSGPIDTWYGISVFEGRVHEIKLYESNQDFFDGNNLTGTIPAEIGNLSELRVLDLGLNNITGSLPSEVGNLLKLEFLNIPHNNGNGLTGSIPPELGNLSNLLQVELNGNNLSGSIPVELGNLPSLVTLGLGGNQLSGSIPVELGNLANIRTINIDANQLTGEIPSELGNLITLQTLLLSQNRLTGTIPASFSNLDNLQELQLWSNQLSGPIPTVIGDMISLRNIDLNSNQFDGTIPPELGNATNLRNLSIPANQLIGEIPVELGNLSNLEYLWLDNNQLTGSIPIELNNLSNLFSLAVARNNLSGSVPELSNLTQLNELRLGQNQFSGAIPEFIGNNINLYRLGLAGNNFTGAVPSNFNQLTMLDRLNIRENQLEDLPDLSNLTQLTKFDISFNKFEADDILPNLGVITQNDGQLTPVLEADSLVLVDLYNALDGPNWFGGQTWLTDTLVAAWEGIAVNNGRVVRVDLNSFGASGDIPAIIADLDSLETFGAAGNQLTSIPPEIGTLTNLKFLFLDFNNISGPLPPEIGNITSLQQIYIQNNNISGTIPPEFSNLSNLQAFWISDNQLTGQFPTLLGGLTNLTTINLSNNYLEGEIPAELNALSNLNELLGANNAFSGSLPDLSGTQIENNFDISGNRFTLQNLIDASFDPQTTPFENFNDQEFTYSLSASLLTPGSTPLTLTITNSTETGNTYQWYKDGIALNGEAQASLTISAPVSDDNGIYTCIITNPIYPNIQYRSESYSLDVAETERKYAFGVESFTSEISSIIGSANEALGQPNSIFDPTIFESTRAWIPTDSTNSESIVLNFDGTPSPINTVWVYGAVDSIVDSVLVQNPNTLEFEFVSRAGVFTDPDGLLSVEEGELNFPLTTFDVSAIKIVVRPNARIDAVAIGNNGIETNSPSSLFAEIVTDTIYNIGWTHINGSDSANYSLERSLDGNNFSEIALIDQGFRRFSDRNVPAQDSVYYRVKAIEGAIESPYSEVLLVENCPSDLTDIPIGSWTGTAEEITPIFGVSSIDTNIQISPNGDGTYQISDFMARYLNDGFGFTEPNIGTLSSGCSGLEFGGRLVAFCGNNDISANYIEFFPGADSLVIEFSWDCGGDVRLTYVRNEIQPTDNAPLNLVGSISDASTIRLTWEDISITEESWVIERSDGDNTNFVEIDTSIPNPQLETNGAEYEVYYDNSVNVGTTYFYRLRSRNSSGDSEPSDTVSLTLVTPIFEELTTGPIIEDQPSNSYSGTWGDYDGDGDEDLYVTNWHLNFDPAVVTKENYLYENNAGSFTRVSTGDTFTDTGFTSRGANWGDFNNDGNIDVYVHGDGTSNFIDDESSFLFQGDGSGGFTINNNFGTFNTSSTHVDFNNDGNLDIIQNAFEFLYSGNGDGTFMSIQDGSSIINGDFFPSFWTALTPDINQDGLPDLFISGDEVFQLYLNRGNFNFELVYDNQNPDYRSRGSVFGDFDHDGFYEIIIGDGENSLLLETDTTGVISERSDLDFLGEDILAQRGFTVLDYDNDGNEDLIWILDDGQPYLFKGNGDATFTKVGSDQQLFAKTSIFSSISVADYDQDGFQDVFISDTEQTRSNSLYNNASSSNNYLRVDLEGTLSNRLGIGAQISAKFNGQWYLRQVTGVNGLWTGNEITTHFGLGAATIVDSVEVRWPSGDKTFLTNVAANQTITIMELAIPVIEIDSIVTSAFQPAITGTVSDVSALIEVDVDTITYNAINNGDSTWVLPSGIIDSLFVGAFEGQIEIIARATNATGVGIDTALLYIQRNPPLVTIDTLISNQRSPELTGTVSDVTATVRVLLDKETYVATTNTDSTWILEAGRIAPPLEDGVYDVVVTGRNDFGDSTDLTTNELRIDATAPTVFVDNIGTSIVSPSLTGFIDDFSATLTINIEGRGDFTPEINEADSTWTVVAGTIDPGFTEADSPILITATAEDSLSNISLDSGQLIIANSIVALEPSRVTTKSFRANWSEVLDAVNYNLEVARDTDFTNIIASVDTLATSFRVENLQFETDYFYRVTYDNGVDAPTTSDTIALKTLILPETVADFNALLDIKNATEASVNWDLGVRKQEWDSIRLESGRVVGLNLSSNVLQNRFPLRRDLTRLRDLNISDNDMVGIDSLVKLRSIENLDVSNNLFDFQDLEPLRALSGLTYSPQKTRLRFNEFLDSSDGGSGEKSDGDSLKILVFNDTTLSLTTNGEYDRYDWFRGTEQLVTNEDYEVNDSTLRMQSIDYDNMGLFRAEVKNDSLPDLIIPVDSMFVLAIAPFTVNVVGTNGATIPEEVDGYLLLTEQRGSGFDTLSRAINQISPFTIDSVILGDYLASVDSDREKYVPTYFSDAFEWIEADTIQFRNDDTITVNITVIPPPPNNEDVGVLDVVLEEDFGDDEEARIDARRRAKRRKCGLRRRRTGGRTDQDDPIFDLFAYGETDDNGEFQFGFLPEGVYRFFVEYPGIPLDPNAEVEFQVGEQGISDTEFSLSAFTTENGVEVEIERVLGVIFEYFKDLKVYPNPAREQVKIIYRHLKAKNVAARMVDLSGNELWNKDIRSGYDGYEEIDVTDYEEGIYLLYIYDKDNRNKNVVSYRIMVRK